MEEEEDGTGKRTGKTQPCLGVCARTPTSVWASTWVFVCLRACRSGWVEAVGFFAWAETANKTANPPDSLHLSLSLFQVVPQRKRRTTVFLPFFFLPPPTFFSSSYLPRLEFSPAANISPSQQSSLNTYSRVIFLQLFRHRHVCGYVVLLPGVLLEDYTQHASEATYQHPSSS